MEDRTPRGFTLKAYLVDTLAELTSTNFAAAAAPWKVLVLNMDETHSIYDLTPEEHIQNSGTAEIYIYSQGASPNSSPESTPDSAVSSTNLQRGADIIAFHPSDDTFKVTFLNTLPHYNDYMRVNKDDLYLIIGEGSYGTILRPQLDKYSNYTHFLFDGSPTDDLSYEERFYRITKMSNNKANALEEIENIKKITEIIDNLLENTVAKKYFYLLDDYTYYIAKYRTEHYYINMPFGGKSFEDLINRKNPITFTPEILANISRHHIFMMEECFDKLKRGGFYHNDVKAANIMFNPRGPADFDIKIIDFGYSYIRPADADPTDFTEIPDDLTTVHGYYYNFPISKIIFSYLELIENDPSLSLHDAATRIKNKSLFIYKVVETVRGNTRQNDHFEHFSNYASIIDVAATVPKINTNDRDADKFLDENPLMKLIIKYLRPVLYNGSHLRTIDELKEFLLEKYFEVLDIYGLFTSYIDILNILINTPARFVGFNNKKLKKKLVLFLREVLFTNHIENSGNISNFKEMIKAHLDDITTDMDRTIVRGGGGGEPPELSAFAPEKLGGWNYTIDPAAVKEYRAKLSEFMKTPDAPAAAGGSRRRRQARGARRTRRR